MKLKIKTVADIVGGKVETGDLSQAITSVVIDSRNVVSGSLFVAFKGEHTDGHMFLEESARKGAVAALVEQDVTGAPGLVPIKVPSTLKALQQLASYRRLQLPDVTVIGVTGSTGKTTTKDLLAAVVESTYPVFASAGNQNNEIGLPLALFDVTPEHRYAVLDMGMTAAGEIQDLCRISLPGLGIITNAGSSHLEKLGSLEAILEAKFELADNIQPPGIMVVNGDDVRLRQRARQSTRPHKTVFFGFSETNDVRADNVALGYKGSSFDVCWGADRQRVEIPLPGKHNVANALAAFAMGLELAVAPEEMADSLRKVTGTEGRLQYREINGVTVLDDTYNASPDSCRAALEVLSSLTMAGKRAAFLGTMLELGDVAADEHFEVGRSAAQMEVDWLVAVGPYCEDVKKGAIAGGLTEENIQCMPDSRQAISLLSRLEPGDAVLFKGSRGVKMELLVEAMAEGGDR